METIKIQAQIRHNAEEISSYLSDMAKWEKNITKKDAQIRGKTGITAKALPVRPGSGTVKVIEKTPVDMVSSTPPTTNVGDEMNLTPATLATRGAAMAAIEPILKAQIPAARGIASTKDAETSERERGNVEYETGNFTAAVKSYTKCLGLKQRNYVGFSNRAMAYIKLKEYLRAESDCTSALSIEPKHVKSLIRRATARNALGKHRAALQDLIDASDHEPGNKQVRLELQRTKEMLRSSVNRAPLVSINSRWSSSPSEIMTDTTVIDNVTAPISHENFQGPDLPYPGEVNKLVTTEMEEKETIVPTPSSNINAAEQEPETNDELKSVTSTRVSFTSTTKTISTTKSKKDEGKKDGKKDGKSSKSVAKSSVIKGYELERELKLCMGDEVALDRLFTPLKPSHANKMFESLMETDVICDFLTAARQYYGKEEKQHGMEEGKESTNISSSEIMSNSVILLNWFKSISEVSSFRNTSLHISLSRFDSHSICTWFFSILIIHSLITVRYNFVIRSLHFV